MIVRIMYTGSNKREEITFELIEAPQLTDVYDYNYILTIPGSLPSVIEDWVDGNNIELIFPVLEWAKDPILFKADDNFVALMLLIHC